MSIFFIGEKRGDLMTEEVVLKIKTLLDNSGIMSAAPQIQSIFSKVKVGDTLSKQIKEVVANLEKETGNIKTALENGLDDKKAGDNFIKSIKNVIKYLGQAGTLGEKVSKTLGTSFDFSKLNLDPKIQAQIKEIDNRINALREDASKLGTSGIDEFSKKLDQLVNKPATKKSDILEAYKEGDFKKAKQMIDDLIVSQNRWKASVGQSKDQTRVDANLRVLESLSTEMDGLITKTDLQQQEMNQLDARKIEILNTAFRETKENIDGAGDSLEKTRSKLRDVGTATEQAAEAQQRYDREVETMKHRIQYFFGMQNAINLVKRALRDTFNSVKELDEVMTETAVVTNFSVGDMWEQMPQYTQKANELGVAIKDVYDATTLYYQQGFVKI